MGHYAEIYGFIQIHHRESEKVKQFFELERQDEYSFANMVFGPYIGRSGFPVFPLGGELKIYHSDNPEEFLKEFFKFLNSIPADFISCLLGIDGEITDLYPAQTRWLKTDGASDKNNSD